MQETTEGKRRGWRKKQIQSAVCNWREVPRRYASEDATAIREIPAAVLRMSTLTTAADRRHSIRGFPFYLLPVGCCLHGEPLHYSFRDRNRHREGERESKGGRGRERDAWVYRGVTSGTKVREVLGKHGTRHCVVDASASHSHTEVGGGCLTIPVMLIVICHMCGCSVLCFDRSLTKYRALEILKGHSWIWMRLQWASKGSMLSRNAGQCITHCSNVSCWWASNGERLYNPMLIHWC